MSVEIKDYVTCFVCNMLRPVQCHEPLKSHDVRTQQALEQSSNQFQWGKLHNGYGLLLQFLGSRTFTKRHAHPMQW